MYNSSASLGAHHRAIDDKHTNTNNTRSEHKSNEEREMQVER